MVSGRVLTVVGSDLTWSGSELTNFANSSARALEVDSSSPWRAWTRSRVASSVVLAWTANVSAIPATAYRGAKSDCRAALRACAGVCLRDGGAHFSSSESGGCDLGLVLVHERGVDVDQHALLPLGDRRVGQHGHLDGRRRMVFGVEDAGLDVQRLGRDPEGLGELLEHLGRRLAQTPFDLAQVGIGDAGLLGELSDGDAGRLALVGDVRPQGLQLLTQLRCLDPCHASIVLAKVSTCKLQLA